MKHIVYTRPNGCVSICNPSPRAIAWMSCGGRWGNCERGFFDTQIERAIAAGHDRAASIRFIHAMQFGGCTTAEAFEIIRDRDCAHLGTGIELWDTEEIPDRWFRNAWRRSHNGGPITINLMAAKSIQWQRINAAVVAENERRYNDVELGPIEIDLPSFRQRILNASDEAELRHVWPVI